MRTVLVALALLVVSLAVVVGFLLAAAHASADVPLELAKALTNLVVAVLITGILSYVLTQRAASQARLDDRARVLASALQNLKAAYEHVQVARFSLAVNPTAGTFADQITRFLEARTSLHRVQRERFILGTDVDYQAQVMLDYLSALADEYRKNYKQIRSEALKEERARRQVLEEGVLDDLADVSDLAAGQYPHVAALIDQSQWKLSSFHHAYRLARNQLYDWLEESSRPPG